MPTTGLPTARPGMTSSRAADLFGPRGRRPSRSSAPAWAASRPASLCRKAGIETFTIYEQSERVGGTWWDNQYPGCRGRRRLVRVLVPVQALRLDPHARPPAGDPPLPRGDGRRLRPRDRTCGSASVSQRAVWDDDAPRVPADAHDRRGARVPRADLGRRVPQRPLLSRLAGPRRRSRGRASTPRGGSTSTTSPGRPSRSWAPARPRRRSCPRSQPGGRQADPVPAGARVGDPEGRPRLHRRGARPARTTRWCTGTGPGHVVLGDGEAALERRRVPTGCRLAHGVAEEAARHYIAQDLRRPARPRRRGHADATRSGASARSSAPTSTRRSSIPTWSSCPGRSTSVTAHGVVDADGVERDADVLVLATGFQPTNYLAHLEVVGRDGPHAPEVLGRRAARVPRHHRARRSRTSTCSTGRAPTAVRSRRTSGNQAAYARRAVKRMIREGVTAHRGEALVGRPVPRVAPVEDGRHRVGGVATTTSPTPRARS